MANIKFDDLKFLKYNNFDSWKNKLNIIFDYLDEPLYIKNTNVCIKQNIGRPFNILKEIQRQNKESKIKEKEEKDKVKYNNVEKKDSSQNLQKNIEKEEIDGTLKIEDILMGDAKNNSIMSYECNIEGNSDDILITDICALSSKYFCISSDDGSLKTHNSYNYREKPVNTIKEYLPNKGIYSLYKQNKGLHLNFNPLYLIGYETIKKLVFNNEYTEYNINEQYTIKNCLFINMIELQNIKGILISTLQQEILSVEIDTNKKLIKTDLTYMINDIKTEKEIVSIEEIGANIFDVKLTDEDSIKFDEKEKEQESKNKDKQILRRKTIGNKLRKNEDAIPTENSKANKKAIYNILLQLEYEDKTGKIILKNKYNFYKNFDVLGKINSYLLLVVDKNNDHLPTLVSLFDFSINTFIKRFYLQQTIPILYHKLENWVQNDVMFIFLDNKMNLTQYMIENEKDLELKTLFSLDLNEIIIKKNKDDNVVLLNVGDKIFLFANNGLIFRINN